MPFIDYETCEPLRIWGRLEPRPRDVDFDGPLAARVHDPLWMLTRQWLMGEFQGEDTGSAVLAKLARRLTPVARYQVGATAELEDQALPVEARVERLPIEFAPITRAQIGRTFLLLLEEAAAAASPPPAAPFSLGFYRTLLLDLYAVAPDAAPTTDQERARARTSARARRTNAALAGRALDGVALRVELGTTGLPADLAGGAVPDHLGILADAAARFRDWFDALYPPPRGAWDPAQLEYQATCTVPAAAGDLQLSVAEHVTGKLDWPAYDQDGVAAGTSASVTDVRSVIPAPVAFAGMPNPRWWQFEDAAVDLGNFRAQATDLARIVVAEFALVFGNNWFAVPYSQPVGTLAEIEGVVVTDVFGVRTLVGPAVGASSGSWSSWDLFSLSPRGTNGVAPALGQHLFLPPALGDVTDGEPHECVTLVRDEAANMVWGVERRVADGLGGSQDGVDAARRFADELEAMERVAETNGDAGSAQPATLPPLRYRLGTHVPEAWIPFMPVHAPGGTRAIRLQRAAMPHFRAGETQPRLARPSTSILRYGLEDPANPAAYYLNEEEVPRAGVTVKGALRRARWLDGRTVVWHGRTVVSGRGEVDSGLRFDVVEPGVQE